MADRISVRFATEDDAGVTVVTFLAKYYHGEEDHDLLGELLGRLIREGCRRLVLDLSGVEDWNSPGFEAQFLLAHKQLLKLGGSVALCIHPTKQEMFSCMGWDRYLHFYAGRQEAVAAVRRRSTKAAVGE